MGETYQQVFVAIISWEHHDISAGEIYDPHEPRFQNGATAWDIDIELGEVERVCSSGYGFDVTRFRIPNTEELPYDKWLKKALLEFYDRIRSLDVTPALVIVWYGGHGSDDDGDLEIDSGQFPSGMSNDDGEETMISSTVNFSRVWNSIRNRIDPSLDHLFILDCCEADVFLSEDNLRRILPNQVQQRSSGTSYFGWLALDVKWEACSGPNSFTKLVTRTLERNIHGGDRLLQVSDLFYSLNEDPWHDEFLADNGTEEILYLLSEDSERYSILVPEQWASSGWHWQSEEHKLSELRQLESPTGHTCETVNPWAQNWQMPSGGSAQGHALDFEDQAEEGAEEDEDEDEDDNEDGDDDDDEVSGSDGDDDEEEDDEEDDEDDDDEAFSGDDEQYFSDD